MKVTIDSSEPLQDALRVIGALYDVELVVSDGTDTGTGSEEPATPSVRGKGRRGPSKKTSRSRAASRPRNTTPKKTAAAKSSAPVSTLELRSWARQNGFTVSERGRVATKVIAAYRAAHSS